MTAAHFRPGLGLLALFTLAVGCGGGGGTSSPPRAAHAASGQDGQTSKPATTASLPTRYRAANGCYLIRQDQQYLASDADQREYRLTNEASQAARFHFEPTQLGAYLLLSGYQRNPGGQGRKNLIGISDPAGEFLDNAGNFIGDVSYLVAGLGDTTEIVLDPVAPLGDAVRKLGSQLEDGGELLGNTDVQPRLASVNQASDLAVWELKLADRNRVTFTSQVTGLMLQRHGDQLGLASPSLADERTYFTLQPSTGCSEYPDAELNADVADAGPAIYLREVPRFQDTAGIDDDDVFGYVDAHAHISAYEFIGGRINYGDPFHKFGVDHALDDCEVNHGPDGMTGLVEHVTSEPGPHDTQGWPTFNDWPRHNSLQHHQSYYRWIERAHLSGLKVLVNHLVHNELLCQINPQKQNDCDTVAAIETQAKLMHDMQDYIDAQHGGPGRGWFRIVTSPAQARQVIANGKMAVVLGVEASKVLNCGEFMDAPECTREQIIERLDRLYAMDVRSLFPVHKFDNAFGGHLPDLSDGVGIGPILYGGNLLETGHPIEFEACPEHDHAVNDNPLHDAMQPFGVVEQLLFQLDYAGDRFPATPEELAAYDPRHGTDHLCNTRGLTDLGRFLIDALMKRGMMIETDHISRKAARQILELTGEQGYPVINSHGSWGGPQALRDRVAKQGGITSSFGSVRGNWVDQLTRDGNRPRPDSQKVGPYGGAGFASDVNGIAQLAGNPGTSYQQDALYPFTSVDGRVVFHPQRTGDRVFDLYSGRGVAHYGLYPDQIADMIAHSDRPSEQIDEAVNQLFTSAEAYLRMWERLERATPAQP